MTEPRQIHVARGGAQLGIFTAEEIVAGFTGGRFRPGDLAWTTGMAAWKPLGEWPEFAAATAAAPSAAAAAAEPLVGDPLPWEKTGGIDAAWGTFRQVLLRPEPTLAVSRLGFLSILRLVWMLGLIGGVCFVVGGLLHAEANALMARRQGEEMLASLSASPNPVPFLTQYAERLRDTRPETLPSLLIQMVFMVLVAPFANALIGGLLWLGMRLVGLLGATTLRQLPAGRVMVAAMLGLAVAGLVAAPFSLLGQGAVPIWIWPWCFAAAFVVSRAIGASVRVNPWWVVLGAVVAYLVLVCVIGCLVGLAIAAAFKG